MKMNFSHVMRHIATNHKDRPAIVNVERGRRYTYGAFHLLTNRIANMLQDALGIGTGDKFLVILENDNVSLLQFPSVMKQAGTVVYSNMRDSLEEHSWQVELVKPKVVFIEAALLASRYDMLRKAGCRIVVMDAVNDAPDGVDYFWDLVDAADDVDPNVELDIHDHIFMLRFTGGTTGRGKCAMYSIDNMIASCEGSRAHPDLHMDATAKMLHVAPLSHGTMLFYYPTFFAGGCNITMNELDLQKWRQTVADEGATHSFLVPTILYRLLEMQRVEPVDLGSLKSIVYGAAPMSPTKLADLLDCFGNIFMQAYAATEVPMMISSLDKDDHSASDDAAKERLGSAGKILPGVEIAVTDEAGNALPAGDIGEIRIRCRAVIKGYFENPEGTAAEFVDGAWVSGDIGYLDDSGFLYIVDRKKDMIISGGFNIYAVEVEAALSSHPAVLNSAVIGIPHEEWGEAVHAEVILRPNHKANEAELVEHVKQAIGSYKAPKSINFVDELPLSVVGKVLRRKVKDKYWQATGRKIA